MAGDAAPSGKAPPGRLRFGRGHHGAVVARGSHTGNAAGLTAAGLHSARFLDLWVAEAYMPAP
ncbi:hypothetical protein AQJ23_17495 [Streptomyces antibioticus]|nr:hypothetical protein AQJ23_17495 [Streptomyces antibioticus]